MILIPLLFLLATEPAATIIDTGSTNIPGLRVTVDPAGNLVTLERRDGVKSRAKISKELHDRFLRDLQKAGPLNELPVNHCMKSASFGSSLYIELGGVRSRDLSCPAQADARAAALKKDATAILVAVRGKLE